MTPASEEEIARAAEMLRAGGVVAFPTETVYGLGADTFNEAAVRRIFELKGRPTENPLIVHVRAPEGVEAVADLSAAPVTAARLALLAPLWPGPLTVVLPKASAVPAAVTAGRNTVAVRVPDHPVAQRLLELACCPIAAPSANRSSYVSPTSARDVVEEFGAAVDAVLDAGDSPIGIESTVVSIASERPVLLRAGAVSLETLERLLGPIEPAGASQPAPGTGLPSPGMFEKHYAPRTPVVLRPNAPADLNRQRAGAIFFSDPGSKGFDYARTIVLSSSGDPTEVAHGLYRALRELDRLGLDVIVADTCPETGIGRAVMDRLRRAAAGR